MMNNIVDLYELLSRRRELCRIHVPNNERAHQLLCMVTVLNSNIVNQCVPAFHPGNDEDPDEVYCYFAWNYDILLQGISWDKKYNHGDLGMAFGYPRCCVHSFVYHMDVISENDDDDYRYWEPAFQRTIRDEKITPTWKPQYYFKEMNPEHNILAHFPCSLNCIETHNIATWRAGFLHAELEHTIFTANNKTFTFSL